jgi:mycothiol synthase
MKLMRRNWQGDEDYWLVREFLREVLMLNARREWSWPLYRWDYWRWHVNENIFYLPLEEQVFLWEGDDGLLRAVLNPDAPGEAAFQVHPAVSSAELEEEMIAVAEEHLAVVGEDGTRRLRVWDPEAEAMRDDILARRGYTQRPVYEHQRRRSLDGEITDVPVADGYTVRALGGPEELPARSWASWRAFHPDEPDEAYEGWEWYRNVQRAPLYRRDLDIVAEAPGGEIAAFCTVWFDDVTRIAAFEPVGTTPEHQRLGLGKAVMAEGLRRARWLGATLATVSSYAEPAHTLYESMGFTTFDRAGLWERAW